MRLQRQGKKGRPFYHIVIADGRAPRDGKYIERLGTYDPLQIPAEIKLDFDRTLNWLQKGASPSDTVRALLSYKGILYKYHLLKGVAKGAMTQEQADVKFQDWLTEKESKISQKKRNLEIAGKDDSKKRFEAEVKVNIAKAEAVAKKLAKAAEKEAAETEVAVEEAPVEEAPVVEAPVAEAPVVEAPVVEAPVVEAPVAEAPVADAPVAEAPATETPATEEPAADENNEPKA